MDLPSQRVWPSSDQAWPERADSLHGLTHLLTDLIQKSSQQNSPFLHHSREPWRRCIFSYSQIKQTRLALQPITWNSHFCHAKCCQSKHINVKDLCQWKIMLEIWAESQSHLSLWRRSQSVQNSIQIKVWTTFGTTSAFRLALPRSISQGEYRSFWWS